MGAEITLERGRVNDLLVGDCDHAALMSHDAPTLAEIAQTAATTRLLHEPLVTGGLVPREQAPWPPESKRTHRCRQTQPTRSQQADGDD